MSPLLAHSGHELLQCTFLVSGVKWTSFREKQTSRNSATQSRHRVDPGRWLATSECLVDWPQSRCCQFQKMAVRIAEIQTASTSFPIVAPFDGDAARSEMCLPTTELVLANGERHMQHAITIVSRDGPAGQDNGLPRGALAKDQ